MCTRFLQPHPEAPFHVVTEYPQISLSSDSCLAQQFPS